MCPSEDMCKLPDISFIGGATKRFKFNIFKSDGAPADTSGINGKMVLVSAANRGGAPTKTFNLTPDPMASNVLMLNLKSSDTKDLFGKYIYQVSIFNDDFEEEPQQGIMYIGRNIDRSM